MAITLPIPNSPSGNSQATNAQAYYSGTNQGEYAFISLDEIINNFTAAYVGEGKILASVLSGDVSFHAHRAVQELHYDTLKSCKSLEVEVCNNLLVPLPHDYVNYVKLSRVDEKGIHNIIYPTRKTSNPFAIEQTETCTDCGDTSDTYTFGAGGNLAPQMEDCGVSTVVTQMVGFSDWDPCSYAAILNIHNINVAAGETYTANTIEDIAQILTNNGAVEPASNGTCTQPVIDGYFSGYFAAVDSYCVDLAASGGLSNFVGSPDCGTQDPGNWPTFTAANITFSDFLAIGNTFQQAATNLSYAGWSQFTQNPPDSINVYSVLNDGLVTSSASVQQQSNTSNSWLNYKGSSNASNSVGVNSSTAVDNSSYFTNMGQRFGLEPEFSQSNGSYFIDCQKGMIHFSSNMSGQTIVLEYLSDGHGTDNELIIPKLAEEAVYKWIAYGCASARVDVPQGIIQRLKQEKFAETRKAKLRLSNVKLEEITQVFRNISKQIKH